VFVKNLTIGSTSCLRLILRWEDFLRPDRDAPNHARRFKEPPGHLELYQLFLIRQAPVTIILPLFLRPVDAVQKAPRKGPAPQVAA
jgi:hypothetical protein